MQQMAKKRISHSRMVRDNIDRTVVQSVDQNRAAEAQNQSQHPEEPARPEQAQSLGVLHWRHFLALDNSEEEAETWDQVSTHNVYFFSTNYTCFFCVFF